MKILVVVPIHDRLEFIGEALESLARQTRLPDEVMVTGNVGVIGEALESLARQIHPLNESVRWTVTDDSLTVRVNAAIRESRSDAFVLLCDDDKLEPSFLEKTSRMMERYSDDIVYTDLRRFGGATNIMPALAWTEEQIELTTVPFITSLCTKKRWERVGGYEDGVPFADWNFWWKCFHTGASAIHLPEPLFLYREHPGQRQHHEDLEESRRILLEHHNRTRASIQERACQA